ncbi:hypothetical protein [Ornithinimicrobium kibberense]|uniref:hypothetical protein n=1 Tax=Ornithinimicrobium kibberense TaxID=282060 RepID=UPI003621165D
MPTARSFPAATGRTGPTSSHAPAGLLSRGRSRSPNCSGVGAPARPKHGTHNRLPLVAPRRRRRRARIPDTSPEPAQPRGRSHNRWRDVTATAPSLTHAGDLPRALRSRSQNRSPAPVGARPLPRAQGAADHASWRAKAPPALSARPGPVPATLPSHSPCQCAACRTPRGCSRASHKPARGHARRCADAQATNP